MNATKGLDISSIMAIILIAAKTWARSFGSRVVSE